MPFALPIFLPYTPTVPSNNTQNYFSASNCFLYCRRFLNLANNFSILYEYSFTSIFSSETDFRSQFSRERNLRMESNKKNKPFWFLRHSSSKFVAVILIGIILAAYSLIAQYNLIQKFDKSRSNVTAAIQQETKMLKKRKNKMGIVRRAEESDNDIIAALLASNSSDYTWIGNRFMPPKGVPTFHPQDYLSYFQKRNTLFIGDSTGRRAYATLFGMMNSTDHSNIPMTELNSKDVIDFNRGHNRKEACNNPERNLYKLNYPHFVCRKLPNYMFSDNHELLVEKNTTSNDPIDLNGKNYNDGGRFDFFLSNCMRDIISILFNETQINMTAPEAFKDYDLIVLSIGIWDAVRENQCAMLLSNSEKYDLVLGSFSFISSPKLQVAFRTPGFNGNHLGDHIVWEIINHAKELSIKLKVGQNETNTSEEDAIIFHNKESNFLVVDWGTVIEKRSFRKKRIRGDIVDHYGLEARLLFAQQLLHELLNSEKK